MGVRKTREKAPVFAAMCGGHRGFSLEKRESVLAIEPAVCYSEREGKQRGGFCTEKAKDAHTL